MRASSGGTAEQLGYFPATSMRGFALLAAALGFDDRLESVKPAILASEVRDRPMLAFADVGAIDDQALLPTLHFEDELRHGSIGHRFEGVADADRSTESIRPTR